MKCDKGLRRAFLSVAMICACLVWTMASVFAAESIDWKKHVITVTGTGVAPPNAVSLAHAQMMARRAAVADGYRQMAELIKGVHVDSESTVENMMLLNDVIKTKVSACIRGARVIEEYAMPNGGYEVIMEVPMFGVSNSLAAAVLPRPTAKEPFPAPTPEPSSYVPSGSVSIQIDASTASAGRYPMAAQTPSPLGSGNGYGLAPLYASMQPSYPQGPYSNDPSYYPSYDPAPSRPSGDYYDTSSLPAQQNTSPKSTYQTSGDYTSLVIDCTGLDLQPAMSPVIRNENGVAIYGANNLDYDVVTTKGMAAYSRSLDVSDISRAGAKPLVVKGISVEGHNINPVITVTDANHVLLENEQSHFLSDLNVIFVR